MLQLRLRLPTGCPHKSMAVDMKSCPEAITVIAEAVPITAEPIQDAEAKLYDDAPVAAVCDAAPADAKHCSSREVPRARSSRVCSTSFSRRSTRACRSASERRSRMAVSSSS